MHHLPYGAERKAFSRYLRSNSTLGEILLWQHLRAGKMQGYTFNRQKPLGNYIVDFYCKPLALVIEVDGAYHFEKAQRLKDEERQQVLEGLGLQFLRFEDEEIKKDLDIVLRKIRDHILNCEADHPGVKNKKRCRNDPFAEQG